MNQQAVTNDKQVEIRVCIDPVSQMHFGTEFRHDRVALGCESDGLDLALRCGEQHPLDRFRPGFPRNIAGSGIPPTAICGPQRLDRFNFGGFDGTKEGGAQLPWSSQSRPSLVLSPSPVWSASHGCNPPFLRQVAIWRAMQSKCAREDRQHAIRGDQQENERLPLVQSCHTDRLVQRLCWGPRSPCLRQCGRDAGPYLRRHSADDGEVPDQMFEISRS